nr:unnamed protein product [Callosobruchus chinensis]
MNDWNILLLEAGGVPSMLIEIPASVAALDPSVYNWNTYAERQASFCSGCLNDGRLNFGHGKGLGGGSIVNYMACTRGNKMDYDNWAAMGNPGWSYKDLLPYFLKMEDANVAVNDSEYRAKGGPLAVSDVRFKTELGNAFVAAAQQAGFPYVDYNGTMEAVAFVKTNLTEQNHPSRPDIELLFIPAQLSGDFGIFFKRIFNVNDELFNSHWKPLIGKPAFTVLPILLQPLSKGNVRLRSTNPFDTAKYTQNYFSDPDNLDIKRMIVAIREIQRIASQPSLKKFEPKIVTTPFPGKN